MRIAGNIMDTISTKDLMYLYRTLEHTSINTKFCFLTYNCVRKNPQKTHLLTLTCDSSSSGDVVPKRTMVTLTHAGNLHYDSISILLG